MEMKIIGVVGAGQMGGGIAQVLGQSRIPVMMMDVRQEALTKAIQVMEKSLNKLADKGRLSETPAAILGRVRTTTELAEMGPCDVVIEAVNEDENLKRKIFETLDGVLSEQAIIATNTSSLSITRLAAYTKRPDRFVGMHFMNPVPIMTLVELIRGHRTSDESFAVVKDLSEKMGKVTVCASDYPGFIINRILMPMINEAFYTLMEGVAKPEDIDQGMKLGTNQPMGPLALADFIGLDTCLSIICVLHNGLGDGKYRPCPLLRKYVEAGQLGRKTGCGVYQY